MPSKKELESLVKQLKKEKIEYEKYIENQITHIVETTSRAANGDFTHNPERKRKNNHGKSITRIDNIIDTLKIKIAGKMGYINNRIEGILKIIQLVARGNYSASCKLSDNNNLFDALGIGINMMIADINEEIAIRKRTENALRRSEKKYKEQSIILEEKNIALKELISQLKEEREKMEDQIRINVKHLLLPLLTRMKNKGSHLDKIYLDLLEENLKKLVSSFGTRISIEMIGLTQKEIEICNLIKSGLTSKEISHLLNISHKTIGTHRNNIRKKLKIVNKSANLSSYLKAF